MPPRRLKDYALMELKTVEESEEKNYYKEEGEMIFNNYKTRNRYGKQIIKVPEKVKEIVNEYIKKWGIEGSLLEMNEDKLYDTLISIFKKTGKRVSVDILRHSYISKGRDIGKLKKGNKREEIARKMGHSMVAQDEYYKTKKEDEEEDEYEEFN